MLKLIGGRTKLASVCALPGSGRESGRRIIAPKDLVELRTQRPPSTLAPPSLRMALETALAQALQVTRPLLCSRQWSGGRWRTPRRAAQRRASTTGTSGGTDALGGRDHHGGALAMMGNLHSVVGLPRLASARYTLRMAESSTLDRRLGTQG